MKSNDAGAAQGAEVKAGSEMNDNGFAGLTYREEAKLVAPRFTLQMNAYNLHADQVLAPSGELNCITLMSSGDYAANVARPQYGSIPPRPINWGRVAFVTAGMPASFKTGRCELQACHLMFSNATVEMLVGSSVSWSFDDLVSYLNIADRGMLSSMRRLRGEALSPGAAHRNMVEALGEALVIDLYRRFSSQGRRASQRRSILAGWQSRRLADHVHAHVADGPVAVSRLAELCGVSASHLGRAFRNTEGITIQEYVETVRMNHARTLLCDDSLTLAAVARACGYAHHANFSTSFRRAFGETPSRFRRGIHGRNH